MVGLPELIGQATSDIYAAESLIHLTTGVNDLFATANIEVESAAVRLFCQNRLMRLTSTLFGSFNVESLDDEGLLGKFMRDSMQFQLANEPKEALRQFVGLSGIRYANVSGSIVVVCANS